MTDPTTDSGLFGQRIFRQDVGNQQKMHFGTESPLSERAGRERSKAADVEGQTDLVSSFDPADAISTYTSVQGIEDGTFVEASPKTHRGVLLTRAVFEKIIEREGWKWITVEGEEDRLSCTPLEYRQRVVPLLMDAALIIQACRDPEEYLWTKGLEGNLTGEDLWIARNDLGGFTIMFPEDY